MEVSITARIRDAAQWLDDNLRRGDTDAFWGNWSKAVEEGYLDALEVGQRARALYRG